MPLGGLLTAGLAPLIGGVIGNVAGQGDRDRARKLQEEALQRILNVNTPDIDQMKLALEQYQSAGQIDPEMGSTINAQDSLMNNVSADPRLREAQMRSLNQLQQMGVGGMRPEDQAALNSVLNKTNQQANANNQAVLQNMQQRGIGGSGNELAAKMLNNQAAANASSQQGLDIAGQASQRALQAIMNAGNLGGQMESMQFGQDSQKAQAQDIINKYNAMNQQQVSNTNVGTRNAAQAQNLANKQSLMNSNTGLANQQQVHNKGLVQQDFSNQLTKAGAAAGAQGKAADQAQAQANATGQMWSGIGTGIGQGAAGVGSYFNNQAAAEAKAAQQAIENNFTQQKINKGIK